MKLSEVLTKLNELSANFPDDTPVLVEIDGPEGCVYVTDIDVKDAAASFPCMEVGDRLEAVVLSIDE